MLKRGRVARAVIINEKQKPPITPPTLERYIRGKDVILIGPAGYLEGQGRGREFDKYDIVARIKWSEADGKDYGSRTDISYWYMVREKHLEFFKVGPLLSSGVKWVIPIRYKGSHVDRLRRLVGGRLNVATPPKDHYLRKIRARAFTPPTTGIEAIAHLLDQPLKSLTVVGMDFYVSGYSDQYREEVLNNFKTPDENLELRDACIATRALNEWPLGGNHKTRNLALYVGGINDPRLTLDKPMIDRIEQAQKVDLCDSTGGDISETSLLIPYKPDGGWRDQLFKWSVNRYKKVFPEFEICVGQTDDTPFNRARAINLAASKATKDRFCIVDIDTFFDRSVLDGFKVKTYAKVDQGHSYGLTEQTTKELLEQKAPVDTRGRILEPMVNNFFCLINRYHYEAINGFDESFSGWGCEDNAFYRSLQVYFGEHEIMDGWVYHLWHPVNPERGVYSKPNRSRYNKLYRRAESRKDIERVRREQFNRK